MWRKIQAATGRSVHYIVDFVCDEAKLIIEIDGGQHGIDAPKADDFVRTRWLEARGFRVTAILESRCPREHRRRTQRNFRRINAVKCVTPPCPVPSP